ncbi:hypothetical protein D8Y22_19095 [Salinadaptatus halalkaliphilus]|uniref:PGF-pre-PGF domain-containing protein n=1 Tax=Salinadaptatus halalkaliphilus TaxID=2419781 RepID=A0A4S3THB5_9EURY|nr:CARDB domain-containing protein [Salinadaptatus halalkaliphilus]THE63272.1 hypothetical protein D8Y22_19095 [Salinadaptatus halalkaliphilus]
MRDRRTALRTVFFVAVALVALGVSGVAAADGPAGMDGDGTESEPYEITNATQLQAMEEDLGAHYVLVENVDADRDAFVPIGNSTSQFTGSFDGQGHTVERLFIDDSRDSIPSEDVGLFGNTSGATIENVGIEDANIVGESGVGALIGVADDTDVSNVYVGEKVVVSGDTRFGGLIGVHEGSGTVSDSLAICDLGCRFDDPDTSGRLVGTGSGTVTDSYYRSGSDDHEMIGEGYDGDALTGSDSVETLPFDFDDTWIATDYYPILQGSVDDYSLEVTDEVLTVGDTTNVIVELRRPVIGSQSATEPASITTNEYVSIDGQTLTAERGGTGTVTASASGYSDEASVTITGPPTFEISEAVFSDTVDAGENVTVSATIENVGTEAGETDVELAVADETETTTVALADGESESVELEYELPPDIETGSVDATLSTADDSLEQSVDVNGNETVSGTLTDGATGETLSGVDVLVDGSVADTTDANGEYELEVLNASAVSVSATKTVGDEHSLEISAANATTVDGATTLDLALHPELAGSGTESDPYEISNARELQAMNQDLSGHYVLVDDVNASGTAEWNDGKGFDPVGTADDDSGPDPAMFSGSLDGRNHSITGLSINRSDEPFVGLFGAADTTTIRDLSLTNVDIRGASEEDVGESTATGGLVGLSGNLTVSSVHVSGAIKTGYSAGGVVGSNYGGYYSDGPILDLNDVTSEVSVTTSTDDLGSASGGVIGFWGGPVTISNSRTSGDVLARGDHVGGFAGWIGTTWDEVELSTISNVSATGNVTPSGSGSIGYAGGLVGTVYNAAIDNASVTGDVKSGGGDRAGGLIARPQSETRINNSYTTGEVTGADNVGGLVGHSADEITDSYAAGSISGGTVAGIAILSVGEMDNVYWNESTTDDAVTSGEDAGAIGLTPDEMTGPDAVDNMDALDYDETWLAVDDDYPLLAWQVDSYDLALADDEIDVGDTTEATVDVTLEDGTQTSATEASSYTTEGNVSVQAGTVTGESYGTDTVTATGGGHADEASITAFGSDYRIESVDAPEIVTAEGSVTVDATIENRGNADDTVDVILAFDGHELASEPTTVAAGGETTATVTGIIPTTAETGAGRNLTVTAADDELNVSVEVRTAEPVSGTVTDGATGEPVSDLELEIDGDRPTDEPVLTDGNGSYAFDAVNGTSLEVAATDTVEGVDLETNDSVDVDGETSLDLELWPALAGNGTAEQPFEISNAHELQAVDRNLSAHYVLVENVSASETVEWNADGDDPRGFDPIGSDDAFAGTFDGDGHTVSGLSVDRSDRGGLFHEIDGSATVERVTLEDVDVEGSVWTGALAGQNNGEIRNVTATGDVDGGGSNTGGLVGYNDGGRIVDSSANVSVTGSHHTPNVGGLVGRNSGDIDRSAASGLTITSGSVDGNVGGLVGRHDALSSIDDSYATTTVSGSQDTTGGLVGQSNGPITGSFAAGPVDESGLANRAGGLVGENGHDLERSYWETNATTQSAAFGEDGADPGLTDVAGVTTENATGLTVVTELEGLAFTGPWQATEGYPRLEWERVDAIEGVRITGLDAPETVEIGEQLTVEATVINVDEESPGDLTLSIANGEDTTDASSLESLAPGETETVAFSWEPETGADGTYTITAATADDVANRTVDVGDIGLAEPREIDTPGTYELEDDITSTETVFEITADNVVLDGIGHTVTGGSENATAAEDEAGIRVTGDNVSVTNLTVRGWGSDDDPFSDGGYGIQYVGTDDGTIAEVTATENEYGIGVTEEQPGPEAAVPSNTVVHNTTATDNEVGVVIRGAVGNEADNTTVADNTIATAESAGIQLGRTTDSTIAGNTVTETGSQDSGSAVGIYVDDSVDAALEHNTVTESSLGILVAGSDGTDLVNNTARDNFGGAIGIQNAQQTTVDYLDVGASTAPNTTVSFEGENVLVAAVDDPDKNPNAASIDRYLSAEFATEDGTVRNLTVRYDDDDISQVEEEDLRLWTNASGSWTDLENSTVDPDAAVVTVETIDEGGTVGAFAPLDPSALAIDALATNSPVGEGDTLSVEATVTNVGEREADRPITLEIDGTAVDSRPLSLAGGDTDSIVLEWDTDGADPGEYEATVDVDDETATTTATIEDVSEPAEFTLGVDDDHAVTAGETATITATVTNEGDEAGTHPVVLSDGDDVLDETLVSVQGGGHETVDLEWETDETDIGEHELTVSAAEDAVTTVVSVAEPTEPAVVAVELTTVTDTVDAGDDITVEYTLENTGTETATQEIDLLVDGTVENRSTVSLEPGEMRTETRTYTTSADDAPALVVALESADDSDDATVSVETPAVDPSFHVEIVDLETELTEGDEVAVTATVTNTGDEVDTQVVSLVDTGFAEEVRDTESISLEPGDSSETTLQWQTDHGDTGSGTVTVSSDTETDAAFVTVDPDREVEGGRELEHGGTYDLGDDIDGENATVEITGNDIVLDGNGNTIEASGSDTSTIRVDDIENVTVRNLTVVHDVDESALEIGTASNVTVEALTVGDMNATTANTTLSFGGERVRVGAAELPPDGPGDRVSLERYFEATAPDGGQLTDVELGYAGQETDEFDAATITLWKFDAETETWTELEDSAVDTAAGVVSVASITEFSTFGAYALEESDSDSGGRSGGGGGGGGSSGSDDTVALELSDVQLSTAALEDGTIELTIPVDAVTGDDRVTDLELRIGTETVATAADVALESDETDAITFTDVDLAALEPGEYEFAVVGDADAGGILTISAAETRTLTVTVVDSTDDSPLEGATVAVDETSVVTDADGIATVAGLEDGSHTVTGSADDYEDATTTVELDGEDGDASLELESETAATTDDSTAADADAVAGFGPVAALVGVILLLSVALKRRYR